MPRQKEQKQAAKSWGHLNTPKNDVFSPEIYSFRVTLFCTLIGVCIHHSLESTKGERQPWPTRILWWVGYFEFRSQNGTHCGTHRHSNAFSYMMGHSCNSCIRTNKRHGWKSTTSVLATATRHALVQSGLQCFSRHINSCRTPYFFSYPSLPFLPLDTGNQSTTWRGWPVWRPTRVVGYDTKVRIKILVPTFLSQTRQMYVHTPTCMGP